MGEALGNPGAAHLVFLAELASAAGADYGHVGEVSRKMVGNRVIVAQASQEYGVSLRGFRLSWA